MLVFMISASIFTHITTVTVTEWLPYLNLWQRGLPGSEIVATDAKKLESRSQIKPSGCSQFPFTSGPGVKVVLSNTIFFNKVELGRSLTKRVKAPEQF